MSNTKHDGGPAFPSDMLIGHSVKASKPFSGMSLRDWFAGQALAGALDRWLEVGGSDKQISGWAYEIADAMLEAHK
jgi:hypothetical protein